MKRLLFFLFLFPLFASAQTYFPGPGIPSGSTSFSPTFRTLTHITDSLQNFYWSNGTKWYQIYTAPQINKILSGLGGNIYKNDGTIKDPVRTVNQDTSLLKFVGVKGAQQSETDYEYDYFNAFITDTLSQLSSNLGTTAGTGSIFVSSAKNGFRYANIDAEMVCCDVFGKRNPMVMLQVRDSSARVKQIMLQSIDGNDAGIQGIIFTDSRDSIGALYQDTSYNANGRKFDRWIPSWGAVKSRIDSAISHSSSTPTSRTLTINGTTQDLSTNRTWNVGTVTSVATGFGLTGGPITTTGMLKADTSSTGLQTVTNFFPKGDTRYLKPGDIVWNDMASLGIYGKLGLTQPNGGIILDGDSNGEGYPLTTGVGVGEQNWFTIVTRALQKYQGAQSGIAFSDFNDPVRYGITLAGTTSVVSGGPVNKALQMTPGSTITFTSNADFVEFWYIQDPSAGSIEIRYNGTLYRTINASGTHLDNASTWSFDPHVQTPATGLNGTFEIKCTGANVTISTLFTNIKRSQTGDTFYFLRNAVSGMTFQDFNLTNMAQITALIPGANTVHLVALGTNSIYSSSKATTSAQFKIDLVNYISTLRNVTSNIIYVIPPRSLETIHTPILEPYSNYYTVIQQVIAQYNLSYIDLNQVIGYGHDPTLFATGDDLHYSVSGHAIVAQYISNQLSKIDLRTNYALVTLKADTGFVRTTSAQSIEDHKTFNGQVSFGGWDGTGIAKKVGIGVFSGTGEIQAYDFTGSAPIPLTISASQIDFTTTSTFKNNSNPILTSANYNSYALPLTGGTLSGPNIISYANPDVNALKITAATGTNAAGLRLSNAGGNYYIGADNNIGTRIQNGSALPYAFVFDAESANSMIFMTNNINRLIIDGSTGNLNLPSLTASKVVFTDASKNLTSTGIGTSSQLIAGDGSLVTGSVTQASNDLTAQTTAGNITTFTVGASTATFDISTYINVTAVSVDVIQGQITYTDENNTSQTVSLSNLSAIGNSTYSPVTIRAKNGTVITVKTNLTTGTGSITYDAGARITQL